MGWPKGMPRKGHINKDGTAHALKGKKSDAPVAVASEASMPYIPAEEASPYDISQMHGMVGIGPITQVCPKCAYAYADGGYCSECGWSQAINVAPYGTYSGKRF
jgi:hypothetical protein